MANSKKRSRQERAAHLLLSKLEDKDRGVRDPNLRARDDSGVWKSKDGKNKAEFALANLRRKGIKV